MSDTPPQLRPETRALDALIQDTIARAASRADDAVDTMLFLGNRHESFPTAVIIDPVLEPVDKLVWMVIMLRARECGRETAFPGYKAIGDMANIASRSTIARAIAILRATRWLTLCARIRNPSGRYRSNVYALHDEPLPLIDALHLDRQYIAFLSKALDHGHARVRAVAEGVLASIDADIDSGGVAGEPEHPIERRLHSTVDTAQDAPRRFFSMTELAVQALKQDPKASAEKPDSHDQNSNTADDRVRNSTAQNSNSSSSSKYINNKTTTTTSSKFELTGESGQPLIYPSRLTSNYRDLADRYLARLAPAQRQPVLDELSGRLIAERKGMRPVFDEIRFLSALCELVGQNKFEPNLGIRVRDARQPAAESAQPVKTPLETDEQWEQRVAIGRAHIPKMHEALETPASPEPNTDKT